MNNRIRRSIYGERAPFNWRLPSQIHEVITGAAVEAGTTTTAFVIDALTKAAAKPLSVTQKQRLERLSLDGASVNVKLRMDGALLDKAQAAARASGCSANRYITYLAWLASNR